MPNDKNRLYTNDDLNKDSKDIAKRRTSPQFSRFTTATSTSLAALSLNPPSPAVQIESNPQIGIPINDSYGSLGLITQIIPLNVYGSSYSIITVTDDITFAFEGIPKGRHIEFTLDILIDKEELPLPIINLTENNLLNPPTLPPLENGTRLILHFEGVNDATGLRFVYLGGTVLGSGLVFPINYPEHNGGTLQNITQILDFADANRHSRKYSLEGDVTFAFDNPPTDKTATVFIQVVQDAIGGHTVSFPPGTINKDVVEGGIKEGANESTIVKIVYFFGVFYAYLEGVGSSGGLNVDLSNLAEANAIPFDLNINLKNINKVNNLNFVGTTSEITGLRALRFIATEENPINIFSASGDITIKTQNTIRFSFSGGLLFEMSELDNEFTGPNITLSGTIAAEFALINKSLLLNSGNFSPLFQNGEIKLVTDDDDVENVWIYSGDRDRNVSEFLKNDFSNLVPIPRFPEMTNLHMNHNSILEVGGIDFDTAGTLQGLNKIIFDIFDYEIFRNVNNLRYRTVNNHQFYFGVDLGWDMSETLLEGRDITLSRALNANNVIINDFILFNSTITGLPSDDGEIKLIYDSVADVSNLWLVSGGIRKNVSEFAKNDFSNLVPIPRFPEMTNLHMNHNSILEVGGIDFDTAGTLQGLNKIIFDLFAYEIFRDGTALRYRAVNFHEFAFGFNVVWEMSELLLSGPKILLEDSLQISAQGLQPVVDGQIRVVAGAVGLDVFIHSGGIPRNVSDFITASAIDQDLIPTPTVTRNLGSFTAAWNDIYAETLRIFSGGSIVPTLNNILATSLGMIFNTPEGNRFNFRVNNNTICDISTNRIRFIDGNNVLGVISVLPDISMRIITENVNDVLEMYNGIVSTNPTLTIENSKTTFRGSPSVTTPYRIEVIQNNTTPGTGRTIGNLLFMAENNVSQDTTYGAISVDSVNVNNGSEDGRLNLGVISNGVPVNGIRIEGDTRDMPKLGFFGNQAISQPFVSGSLENLISVLRSLGLIR